MPVFLKKPFLRGIFFALLPLFLAGFWIADPAAGQIAWPRTTLSMDGTPVSFEVLGSGTPVLVFVHGWSCDARYWRNQIHHFSKEYTMIFMDLAGHGHSGMDRTRYTMESFGQDVQAVVQAAGCAKVILIGHSMGGPVIAQAAGLMPERVLGLIGVDTLCDIEYPLSEKELEQMTAPLKKEFRSGVRGFVSPMFLPDSDPEIREWVLCDMAAAPKAVAMSALTEMMAQYRTGQMARVFDALQVPVVLVNADLWPVNLEANRRHMADLEVVVLKHTDHFLMMNQPERFNPALSEAIRKIMAKTRTRPVTAP